MPNLPQSFFVLAGLELNTPFEQNERQLPRSLPCFLSWPFHTGAVRTLVTISMKLASSCGRLPVSGSTNALEKYLYTLSKPLSFKRSAIAQASSVSSAFVSHNGVMTGCSMAT